MFRFYQRGQWGLLEFWSQPQVDASGTAVVVFEFLLYQSRSFCYFSLFIITSVQSLLDFLVDAAKILPYFLRDVIQLSEKINMHTLPGHS